MTVMAKPVPIPTPEQIKKIRESLGLTQQEAADRVQVGQGVWASWESGTRTPSRQSALLLKLLKEKKL
jgi:DNA-binding transcriptional regulator YiaG